MLNRFIVPRLRQALDRQAAVALLGPRQVGKTTLALQIAGDMPSVRLDLESPEDIQKLGDPVTYLSQHAGKLVILDEVHRMPELFQSLRVLIDKGRMDGHRNAQFLILGSASIDLLRQSSESLAGRISYIELAGLNVLEISPTGEADLNRLWLRGGFPDSYLCPDDAASVAWREDFIRTYLERDIPQLGPRIPSTTLRRFWTMLAHLQGTMVNASKIAENLGVSSPTVKRYLDLLDDLLLVRRVPPWFTNTGKRLVKSPRTYVRDSGLLHRLLGIANFDALMAHPVVGASWEGFVIENLLSVAPLSTQAFFYRTSGGAEIDLLLQMPEGEQWAIEIKRSRVAKVTKGFYVACADLKPDRTFIVYGGEETYPMSGGNTAIGLANMMRKIQSA